MNTHGPVTSRGAQRQGFMTNLGRLTDDDYESTAISSMNWIYGLDSNAQSESCVRTESSTSENYGKAIAWTA